MTEREIGGRPVHSQKKLLGPLKLSSPDLQQVYWQLYAIRTRKHLASLRQPIQTTRACKWTENSHSANIYTGLDDPGVGWGEAL